MGLGKAVGQHLPTLLAFLFYASRHENRPQGQDIWLDQNRPPLYIYITFDSFRSTYIPTPQDPMRLAERVSCSPVNEEEAL